MRPRYGASRAGRLVGMLFQAASQVSFSHSSASWALCRMLSAILRQYAPNFAAVSASACSSRAQYRATIKASSMVLTSFIYKVGIFLRMLQKKSADGADFM